MRIPTSVLKIREKLTSIAADVLVWTSLAFRSTSSTHLRRSGNKRAMLFRDNCWLSNLGNDGYKIIFSSF